MGEGNGFFIMESNYTQRIRTFALKTFKFVALVVVEILAQNLISDPS